MKKIIFVLGALTLLGVSTYAQTQKTNRTKTRSHDRSETIKEDSASNKLDKANPESDMDRNNSNKTVTPSKSTNPSTPK